MDSIYKGKLSARVRTPCGTSETFTGDAYLRAGPIRSGPSDSNPFYLAIGMDDPNVKLNIVSMGATTQYWNLNATSSGDGYIIAGTLIDTDNDGGYNRILALTADKQSRALVKRDFCGKPQIFASFPTGIASINGPITPQNAKISASLHTHAVHEDPNMQSQFYLEFNGDWDSSSAKLDTTQPNRPNWPVAGSAQSQSRFPAVTINDPSGSSGSSGSTATSVRPSSGSSTAGAAAISSGAANPSGPKLKGLSTGPIVGIIFGALFVIIAVFLAGRWALLRHRRNKKANKASVPAAGSVAPAFTPQMSYGYNTLHDAEAQENRRSISAEPMLKSVNVGAGPEAESRPYGSGPHHDEYSDHPAAGQPSPGQAPRGNRDDPFADDADDADVPRIAVSHHRNQ